MAKWHIRDEGNDRASCAPHGQRDLVISVADWIGRIPSDQCAKCAKIAATRIKIAKIKKGSK